LAEVAEIKVTKKAVRAIGGTFFAPAVLWIDDYAVAFPLSMKVFELSNKALLTKIVGFCYGAVDNKFIVCDTIDSNRFIVLGDRLTDTIRTKRKPLYGIT
jgi:hypothetical protein